MIHKLACTGLSPSVITFSKVFHFIYFINVAVLLPRYCRNNNGLGLSPVARRYWGNHVCFLLLQAPVLPPARLSVRLCASVCRPDCRLSPAQMCLF